MGRHAAPGAQQADPAQQDGAVQRTLSHGSGRQDLVPGSREGAMLGEHPFIATRRYWAPPILVTVAVLAWTNYPPPSPPEDSFVAYYGTTAQVVVTLYVAIVIEMVGEGGRQATFEHWLFMLVSCAGLLASLRAMVAGSDSRLFAVAAAGVAAAVLLLAEALVVRMYDPRRRWQGPLWSVLFVVVLVVFLLWP